MSFYAIKKNGFTLIELLLVIFLLSALALMSTPKFGRSYSSMKFHKRIEEIVYTMRYAQSIAITEGKHVRFIFDKNFSSYWLEQEKGETGLDENETDRIYEKIQGRWGKNAKDLQSYMIYASNPIVDFSPDGLLSPTKINICEKAEVNRKTQENLCFIISTQEQRGRIRVLKDAL